MIYTLLRYWAACNLCIWSCNLRLYKWASDSWILHPGSLSEELHTNKNWNPSRAESGPLKTTMLSQILSWQGINSHVYITDILEQEFQTHWAVNFTTHYLRDSILVEKNIILKTLTEKKKKNTFLLPPANPQMVGHKILPNWGTFFWRPPS